MVKSIFWTPSGARLKWVRGTKESELNWLFLPGGPGLGSESLIQLLDILKLPGNLWRLDLPGDGSNTTSNNGESFSKWAQALIEAVQAFDRVVLVGHSTGGMYALSLPELEDLLEGLVLLDSAPHSGWQAAFGETVKSFSIPEINDLEETYRKSPNNAALKVLTLASAPYLFTQEGMEMGKEMLASLPYNYEACEWSAKHFDTSYTAKWFPRNLPTLILTGEKDLITPLRLFKESPQFQRENIVFKSISGAGHFPWLENPQEVSAAFDEYWKRCIPK